jgi:hypothetical protein
MMHKYIHTHAHTHTQRYIVGLAEESRKKHGRNTEVTVRSSGQTHCSI